MIKVGFKVKASYPKNVMNNEKTVFRIGMKDKNFDQNKIWHNVSFMTDFVELSDKEEVEITEIAGFSVSNYKDTPQFTVYGKVAKIESVPLYEEPQEPPLTIDSDELPF